MLYSSKRFTALDSISNIFNTGGGGGGREREGEGGRGERGGKEVRR